MNIIDCDLHARYRTIAWVSEETGERVTRRFEHENGEVRRFYANLPPGTRVGIEATFPALWFERMLAECGQARWVGDGSQPLAAALLQGLWVVPSCPMVWQRRLERLCVTASDMRQALHQRPHDSRLVCLVVRLQF